MENNDKIRYQGYAFFSAYTTIPSFEDPDVFFKRDIKKIFKEYRSGLKAISKKANRVIDEVEFDRNWEMSIAFKPIPYCLFGEFDLAIFSLIDDFSFASKKFKPSPSSENFKYQVNTGIIPLIDVFKPGHAKTDEFQNKMLPNFFNGTTFYPFTGITSIKLNNSMLVGIGQNFIELINFYLVSFIDKYIQDKKKENDLFNLFYLINENLGWNELTVYFFGNTVTEINEISILLKNNKLRDVLKWFEELDYEIFNQVEIYKKIEIIKKSIGENSLLAALITKDKDADPKLEWDYLESHPVVASTTVFGYHIDNLKFYKKDIGVMSSNLLELQKNLLYQKTLNEHLISIAWNLKPGHEENANETIIAALPQSVKNRISVENKVYHTCQVGKFPFIFPTGYISFAEYFEFLSAANGIHNDSFAQNIIRMKSKITFQLSITYKKYDKTKHYNYKLNDYTIGKEKFKSIRAKLRVSPVPHTIKSQIENLILNYNDAITDPLMYNYFISLKMPLLKFLEDKLFVKDKVLTSEEKVKDIEFLKNPIGQEDVDYIMNMHETKKPTLESIEKRADTFTMNVDAFINFIEPWNKGYWNRHFHGYYFTEINDFNIEHHGGIQQILFCYDIIYKMISKRVYGLFSKEPFVNVRIYPIIKSTPYSNTINFTHLFKPAIYACECVHEVANHVIPFLVNDCKNPKYSFLLNPRSETDENIKIQSQRFETGIKRLAGTKDGFEVKFIDDYFGLNSIRYLFTDYISYMLAYNFVDNEKGTFHPTKSQREFDNLIMYYHTHWYLFLTRADLYVQNTKIGESSWYFDEEHFKFLFIRCNLMFYLMCDYDEASLNDINKICPSSELNVLWTTQKDSLIGFVVRLGDALKKEFRKMGTSKESVSIAEFKGFIVTEILDANNFDDIEYQQYQEVINLNFDLIVSFHNFFKNIGDDFYNIIIRNSTNIEIATDVMMNVDFYEEHSGRQLFLDPKGNIFSTSEVKRKEVLNNNITYLKNIWNVAMINAKRFYR